MKKAVIVSGGTQHIVSEGEEIVVNYVGDEKSVDFTPIMIVDGKESIVDAKKLAGITVSTKVLGDFQGEKVIALRYKAKKRVQTRRGHRQKHSRLKIVTIA